MQRNFYYKWPLTQKKQSFKRMSFCLTRKVRNCITYLNYLKRRIPLTNFYVHKSPTIYKSQFLKIPNILEVFSWNIRSSFKISIFSKFIFAMYANKEYIYMAIWHQRLWFLGCLKVCNAYFSIENFI